MAPFAKTGLLRSRNTGKAWPSWLDSPFFATLAHIVAHFMIMSRVFLYLLPMTLRQKRDNREAIERHFRSNAAVDGITGLAGRKRGLWYLFWPARACALLQRKSFAPSLARSSFTQAATEVLPYIKKVLPAAGHPGWFVFIK